MLNSPIGETATPANDIIKPEPWHAKIEDIIARLNKAQAEFASLKRDIQAIDPLAPFGELKGPIPVHPSRARDGKTSSKKGAYQSTIAPSHQTSTTLSNASREQNKAKKVPANIRTPEGRLSLAHYCIQSLERDVETLCSLLQRVKE
jgi:hypothetical protein